jgi:broad specificity phosphatase PhoE
MAMKSLHLLRHAKSSWKDPGLNDHDRPLSKRGRQTAKMMAAYLRRAKIGGATADLREQGIPRLFDLTYSSLRLLYQPELSHQDDAVSALLAAPKAPEH